MSEENDPWCYRDAEGSDSKDDTTSDSHRRSRVKTHSGPNLSAIEPRCGHNVTLPPEAEGISASTDVTFQNSSTAADTIEETVNHPKMVKFEDIPCPKLQLLVRQCSGGISKNRVNSIYLCPLEELLSAADGDVDHAMWLSEHVRAFVKNRIPPQEQEHQHPDRKALFGVKAKMLRKAAKVLRLCHWEIPKAVAYWEILSDEKLNLPASDRDAEKQRMRERFNGRSEYQVARLMVDRLELTEPLTEIERTYSATEEGIANPVGHADLCAGLIGENVQDLTTGIDDVLRAFGGPELAD